MKKIAYTLAEILITLTVVGVVAALTMPALISSSQNQKNAAALAVAVSDWENAMAAMMSADGATDMFETTAFKNLGGDLYGYDSDDKIKEFVGEISKYIDISNYSKGFQEFYDGLYWKKINGTVNNDYTDGAYTEPLVLTTPKGIVYGISTPDSVKGTIYDNKTETDVLELGGNLNSRAASIDIDVNGKKKPNTYGRDVFSFALGSDGLLYPSGGLDFSIFVNGDDSDMWDKSDSVFQCINLTTSSGSGCTARLVENNFKMDY